MKANQIGPLSGTKRLVYMLILHKIYKQGKGFDQSLLYDKNYAMKRVRQCVNLNQQASESAQRMFKSLIFQDQMHHAPYHRPRDTLKHTCVKQPQAQRARHAQIALPAPVHNLWLTTHHRDVQRKRMVVLRLLTAYVAFGNLVWQRTVFYWGLS